MALTLVLLTSAGLLLRGVAAARELDLGFRIDDISQVSVGLPQPDYDAGRIRVLFSELSAALHSNGLTSFAFAAPGRSIEEARLPDEPEDQTRPVDRFDVSPSYFDVLGIGMAAGRNLVESDRDRGLAVVNETLARHLWHGESPIGRSFVADGRTLEVIGVVRAELALASLAASVPGLVAFGLATVGMFGGFAYAMRQRTREIGIRIALGAQSADVLRSVLSGNARVVLLGLGAGVVGAVAASQLLRSMLYGLSPLDPLTHVGVALLLAATAMVASYVPARRALRVDAATTLRAE